MKHTPPVDAAEISGRRGVFEGAVPENRRRLNGSALSAFKIYKSLSFPGQLFHAGFGKSVLHAEVAHAGDSEIHKIQILRAGDA